MPSITGVIPENILKRMSKEDRPKGPAGMTAQECEEKSADRLEKELQKQICGLLDRCKIWYARSRMDKKTTGRKGTPDFMFAVKGRPIAWECKIGNRDLSDEQEDAMIRMECNGWDWYTVYSYNEALDILIKLGVEL